MSTPLNIPCCIKGLCPDPANPFENLSAESPDADIFLAFNTGNPQQPPPLGWTWGTVGCKSLCTSTVSQADADLCAQRQQVQCTVQGCQDPSCVPNNGGDGGWVQPGQLTPAPVVFNDDETGTAKCPDGLPFNFILQAGSIAGINKGYVNQQAQSLANILAEQEKCCLSDVANGCVGKPYTDFITVTGGTAPFTFFIIAGSVPPGITATVGANFITLSGTPTVPGNWSFTVTCNDSNGLFIQKTYTIAVVGLTNSMPGGNQGSAYNFTFTSAGGTPPYTYSVFTGLFPAGLTLASNGIVSGTPTTGATYAFTVLVSDSAGNKCVEPQTVTIGACNCSTQWFPSVGNCRLRITGYVDGVVSSCPGHTPSGSPAWDGTLPQFIPGFNTQYHSDPSSPLSINGGVFNGAQILPSGPNFILAIFSDVGGVAQTAWQGTIASSCPIGVYTFAFSTCGNVGPATLTIEAYSL